MGSRSSVTTMHTPTQNSPDASTNSMYDGSPGISSVHLVGSEAASFSRLCIPSIDYFSTVKFSRFTVMVIFQVLYLLA